MKVLSFGEILWDLYPDRKCLGGAPLNFAAHLAKHGEDAYMLSAVGADPLGEAAIEQIRNWGVHADFIARCTEKQTGRCVVTLDEKSVPSYNLLEDVAYDHISCGKITDTFDVLYFGTLALRGNENRAVLAELLKKYCFREVFVDVNIRPPFYCAETVRFAVENATILKVSAEELPFLYDMLGMADTLSYEAFAKELARTYDGLNCVIVTLGEKGAYVLECSNQTEHTCGCSEVEVKSTVGAGDSFSAAFLSRYMGGEELDVCLRHAVKVAGYVVSEYDAVPDYRVEEFC